MAILNLFFENVTDVEQSVGKGLNFVPAPQRIPTSEIVAAIQCTYITRRTNEQNASELRGSVCSALKRSKRAKPLPPNPQEEERSTKYPKGER